MAADRLHGLNTATVRCTSALCAPCHISSGLYNMTCELCLLMPDLLPAAAHGIQHAVAVTLTMHGFLFH